MDDAAIPMRRYKTRNPEAAARVQARLDDETRRQLAYLVEATGHCVSQILRDAVACYYREMRSSRPGLRHFAKLIGKGHSGRSDIATNYKQYVAEGIDAKHGPVRK